MAEGAPDVATALALGQRERQEDAILAQFAGGMEGGFAILSDGMGGHDDGDLASRLIVAEMFRALSIAERDGLGDHPNLRPLLRDAILAANQSLRHAVEAGDGQDGMGGTVIAAVFHQDRLSWISIGDSALYLYRDGVLQRLNEVHSLAPQIDMLVQKGEIDAETARRHPQRSCLTSALVGGAINKIDCPEQPLDLRPGDVVVMASDGLEVLTGARLGAMLGRHAHAPASTISQMIMSAVEAEDAPDQDNTSLIVIKPDLPETAAACSETATPGTRGSLADMCGAFMAQVTRGSAL